MPDREALRKRQTWSGDIMEINRFRMEKVMEFVEFTGKNVDEAITEACQKLEVTSDKLIYEVTDEGREGLFGIGSRCCQLVEYLHSLVVYNFHVSSPLFPPECSSCNIRKRVLTCCGIRSPPGTVS